MYDNASTTHRPSRGRLNVMEHVVFGTDSCGHKIGCISDLTYRYCLLNYKNPPHLHPQNLQRTQPAPPSTAPPASAASRAAYPGPVASPAARAARAPSGRCAGATGGPTRRGAACRGLRVLLAGSWIRCIPDRVRVSWDIHNSILFYILYNI